MASSGMLRRVALVRTDVPEEFSANVAIRRDSIGGVTASSMAIILSGRVMFNSVLWKWNCKDDRPIKLLQRLAFSRLSLY
jgi:hypothetical protein